MNETEFRQRFPNASRDTVIANLGLQPAKPEHKLAQPLGQAAQGEETCMGSIKGRIIVRFHFYRVRCQDWDNCAGSCKQLCDGLRGCGLLHGDEPWKIKLEVEQTKVKTFAEERTEITLIWP